tara:strand:- start:1607 stop:2113 length:507 start_codon:yes stop_codon:yes gene_type:complete
MAHTETAFISQLTQTPPQRNKTHDGNTPTQKIAGDVEFSTTTAGDTLALFKIPVNAKLVSLKIGNDILATTSGTLDVGFYQGDDLSTTSPGTVVLIDAIVSALSVTSAIAMTDYRYETLDLNTTNQVAWELAGLTAQPDYGDFVIAVSVKAINTAATGTLAFIAEYTI